MLFTKLFVTKLFFRFSCVKSESKSVGSLSQLEAITSLPRSVCVLCSFRLAHCATVYIIYNSWSVTDHNNSRKRAAAQLVITLPHICCNVLLVTAWRSGTDSKILKKCLFSYCNHVYRGTQVKLKYRNLMKQLIPVSASVASVLCLISQCCASDNHPSFFPPTNTKGTRIIYERKFLLDCRSSPLARTPPANLPVIPGVTSPASKDTSKKTQNGELLNNNTAAPNSSAAGMFTPIHTSQDGCCT